MQTGKAKDAIWFHYTFISPDGEFEPIRFRVELDPKSLCHRTNPPENVPDWAAYDEKRCGGCGLNGEEYTHCPVVLSLVELVNSFSGMLSHTEADVRVETPERVYFASTSVQHALSSLVGLYMATSACPSFGGLRAMARFHLPFASVEETVFRAAGAYLIGQYFERQDTGAFDVP